MHTPRWLLTNGYYHTSNHDSDTRSQNLSTLTFDVQKALMLNNQRFIFRSGKEGFPILVKSSEVRGVRCAANAIASVFDVGCLAILMLLLSRGCSVPVVNSIITGRRSQAQSSIDFPFV
jgi:hypothetical protein